MMNRFELNEDMMAQVNGGEFTEEDLPEEFWKALKELNRKLAAEKYTR